LEWNARRGKKGTLSRLLGKKLPCVFLFPVHTVMIPYPAGKTGRICENTVFIRPRGKDRGTVSPRTAREPRRKPLPRIPRCFREGRGGRG
jgi:hypothetical protein